MKKLICAFLALAMLTVSFSACANNDDNEPVVTGTSVDTGTGEYVFKEADYQGEEFKILHYGNTAKDFHDEYIWSEGFSSDIIAGAVIERNKLVEDRYNVKIAAEECSPMSEATNRIQAGMVDFGLIYEWGSRSVSAALDGMLFDFREFTDVDFENSWWVPSAAESLTLADRMFINTNMISMNSISWAGIVFFNKMLMDKLQYEYPYEYVQTNTWTCDVMLEMMNRAEEDVNGDGEMTLADQYGGFGVGFEGILYYEPLARQNDDGSYTVIGYTDKMVARYSEYSRKLEDMSSHGYEYFWDEVDSSIHPSIHVSTRKTVFGDDHALFMAGSIDMTKELVDMKHDYGVVPDPKADPSDEWSTGVDYNAPMFSVPVTVDDPDMTSVILDYMAYESENILLPAYYETTLKTKRMQDQRDYEMLDIVRASVEFDPISLYIRGIPDNGFGFRDAMFASGNFSSVWKKYSKKAQAGLDDLIEKMESIGY